MTQTSSDGPTVSFHRSIIVSFMCSTSRKGRAQLSSESIPPWQKCGSAVKKFAMGALMAPMAEMDKGRVAA